MNFLGKSLCTVSLAAILAMGCIGCSGTSNTNANNNANNATTTTTATVVSTASNTAANVADNYVTASWLKDNYKDVLVIDCRSAEEYAAGHVPGAINLNYKSASATSKAGGVLAHLLAGYGVNGSKDIVLYTNVSIFFGEDGCMDWTLQEAGITNAKILDGGWAAWTAAGGTTSTDTVTLSKVDPASGTNLSNVGVVIGQYVYENLNKATIVDVRGIDEYNGKTNYGEAKLGRIPGAKSLPIDSLYNSDYTIKSGDELQKLFDNAGLTDKNAEIITYCTGGIRASSVATILSEAGYTNVKVYVGSFTEWAKSSTYPVES